MEINEIATLATTRKKPTKLQAFYLIKDLIESEKVDKESIAKLYGYFLPSIPKKPKTIEQWIGKAIRPNDVREYIRYIHVENGIMAATDGHRIHFAPSDMDDGFYNTSLDKVDQDHKFPDISKVIPSQSSMKESTSMAVHDGQIISYNINGVYVNKEYVDQAISGMNDPTIYYSGPHDSILITDSGTDRKAVIMPMRM